MPIDLFTGVPGSGKTLHAVKRIRDAVKEGRTVYSNIKGLKLDHAPIPADWTECPDGSLIVIDECQERWPATGKPGRSDMNEIQALDTHRHRGIDIILMTPAPTKVHHQVRECVSYHTHVVRTANMERCTLYTWANKVVLDPMDRAERDGADSQQISFDKSLYPLYKSAEIHTIQRRIPKKVKFYAVLLVGIFSWFGFKMYDGQFMLDGSGVGLGASSLTASGANNGGAGRPTAPAPLRVVPTSDGLHDWTFAETVRPVAGCIMNARSCRCYSEEGLPLDLPDMQCRIAMDRPLPFRFVDESRQALPQGAPPSVPSVPSLLNQQPQLTG